MGPPAAASRKIRRALPAGILLLSVWSGHSIAGVYDPGTLVFTTSGQSIWGEGAAPGFDEFHFLGTEWNTGTATLGEVVGNKNEVIIPGVPPIRIPCVDINPFPGVTCLPGTGITTPGTDPVTADTRFGAEVSAQTSGKVGFNLSAKADSGSVNATLEYDATLDLPDGPVVANEFFNLNPDSALAGVSEFDTNFPEISAKVEAVLGAKATLGGRICVTFAGCAPDTGLATTTIGFDPKTLELVSFNDEDSPGQIKVLGIADPALFQFGRPIEIPPSTPGLNFGNVTVEIPDINTVGGVSGTKLTSNGAGDLLDLKVDIDGLILNSFGLPAVLGASLDAGIFSVGYDLIDVEYGPVIEVLQDFELDPTLMVELVFDKLVNVAGLGITDTLTAPWDLLPDIALLGSGQLVSVSPRFYLDVDFTNMSTLGVDGEFLLKVLEATFSLTGLGLTIDVGSLGPLFQFSKRDDLFDLPPLFNETFALGGFNDIFAASFLLSSKVPAPGTLVLVLTALAWLLRPRGRSVTSGR